MESLHRCINGTVRVCAYPTPAMSSPWSALASGERVQCPQQSVGLKGNLPALDCATAETMRSTPPRCRQCEKRRGQQRAETLQQPQRDDFRRGGEAGKRSAREHRSPDLIQATRCRLQRRARTPRSVTRPKVRGRSRDSLAPSLRSCLIRGPALAGTGRSGVRRGAAAAAATPSSTSLSTALSSSICGLNSLAALASSCGTSSSASIDALASLRLRRRDLQRLLEHPSSGDVLRRVRGTQGNHRAGRFPIMRTRR